MNITINKLREYAIAAYLILVPLCYKPAFSRQVQEDFFQYMAIGLTAFFVGNFWIGAFLILNVFLFVYNGATVGFDQVFNIFCGTIIFIFSKYFFSKNRFDMVYKPIMFVTFVTIGWMALQLFNIDPLFSGQNNMGQRLVGVFNDPIGFFGIKEANGTFLTLAMPIVAAVNPILSLLLLIPIKTCQSSSVYLATLCAILFYTFYLHRKQFFWFLLLIPIGAGYLIVKDLHTDPKTFTSRFPVWHSAISLSLENPIGYGPDSYRNFNKHKDFKFVGDNLYQHGIVVQLPDGRIAFRYYSVNNDQKASDELMKKVGETHIFTKGRMDEWDNPHNMYVNVIFQYGIIGLILMVGLLTQMYLRFKTAIKSKELIVITSCFLVYLVTGLTHFPIDLARTGYLFPIILGGFFAITDRKANA